MPEFEQYTGVCKLYYCHCHLTLREYQGIKRNTVECVLSQNVLRLSSFAFSNVELKIADS